MLKEKLKEYARRLQGTVEELGRRNYNLGREGRILKVFVRNYQDQNRFLEGFALMVFILGQLVVGLYLLGFFDKVERSSRLSRELLEQRSTKFPFLIIILLCFSYKLL